MFLDGLLKSGGGIRDRSKWISNIVSGKSWWRKSRIDENRWDGNDKLATWFMTNSCCDVASRTIFLNGGII